MQFAIVNLRTVVSGPYGVSPPIPIRPLRASRGGISSEMPTAPCLPRPGGRRSEATGALPGDRRHGDGTIDGVVKAE